MLDWLIIGGGIHGTYFSNLLLHMHPIRVSPYDFDPCWIGPKCMRGFLQIDIDQRRQIITAARRPGTAPQDVVDRIAAAAGPHLNLQRAVVRAAATNNGRIRLSTSAGIVESDRVILATGYDQRRPGGSLIDGAITNFGLRTAACGYPLVGKDLRWAEHIFIAGPLAELALGPCARNIVGARNAGRRLLEFGG